MIMAHDLRKLLAFGFLVPASTGAVELVAALDSKLWDVLILTIGAVSTIDHK
jgi:hypothetical protein